MFLGVYSELSPFKFDDDHDSSLCVIVKPLKKTWKKHRSHMTSHIPKTYDFNSYDSLS